MSNKILVVEDESDLQIVIVQRLEAAGYTVSCAANGLVALEHIKKNKPDLIITDVIMPELDGFGMLKELKKNPATSSIPVIVLTARGKMADTFNSMGVADFLPKPFDSITLINTVRKNLSSGQTAPASTPEILKNKQVPAGNKAMIAGVDKLVMQEISKLLTEKDYFVEIVTDSLQIFSRVETLNPKLLLLEIPLDDLAAQDIVRIVRGLPKTKTIPILLYSFHRVQEGGTDDPREKALSVDTAKEECLEAGATQYLGSFNEKTFITSISKYL